MKKLVLLTSAAVLALFSLHATAENVTLYYADGTVAERQAQVYDVVDVTQALPKGERGAGLQVTLDSFPIMQDPNQGFAEIFVAQPGQEVNLTVRFNALGSLEVPFSNLVGRSLVTIVVAPTLKIQRVITITIEPDDDNVVGIGVNETINPLVNNGPFLLLGINKIPGISTLNDIGAAVRVIATP